MKMIGTWTAIFFGASVLFGAVAFAGEVEGEAILFSSTRAGEFIGKSVKNEDGEYLGTVKDLVFGEDRRVEYLIVGRGGFLGIGGRLVPIPIETTGLRHELESLIVNVSVDRLEAAPQFSRGSWPDFRDAEWERSVHGYYEKPGGEGTPGVEEAPGELPDIY